MGIKMRKIETIIPGYKVFDETSLLAADYLCGEINAIPGQWTRFADELGVPVTQLRYWLIEDPPLFDLVLLIAWNFEKFKIRRASERFSNTDLHDMGSGHSGSLETFSKEELPEFLLWLRKFLHELQLHREAKRLKQR